jgi:chitin deacetylase
MDSVIANGHICARGVTPPTNFTYNFISQPSDYYNLPTYPMSNSVTLAQFFGQIQNVINGGGFLSFLYHSLDSPTLPDTWYSQVEVPEFELQMDTLVSVRKQIWITTMMQAIKYHKEKNCATLSQVQAPNGSTWVLNLTDTLSNNSVYNQPLSLKLKMNGVAYTSVQQNGTALTIDSI